MSKREYKLESEYQSHVIDILRQTFPGCVVLKNDPDYIQGIPDLLLLWNDRWAALECKRYKKASIRPNQKYYVDKLNSMSYSSFIYPENEEAVMHELQQTLRA